MPHPTGYESPVNRRSRILTALVLCGGLGTALVATGADTPVSGQLQATGSGQVSVEGRFVSFGLVGGRGSTVRLLDRAGDATVTMNGRVVGARRARGQRVISQPGRFYVSGSDVVLEVRGTRLSVNASGIGLARLRGQGMFSLNGRRQVAWSTAPTLQVGNTPGEPPAPTVAGGPTTTQSTTAKPPTTTAKLPSTTTAKPPTTTVKPPSTTTNTTTSVPAPPPATTQTVTTQPVTTQGTTTVAPRPAIPPIDLTLPVLSG